MKRNTIRKNDRVIVKNPEVFIRCGYPLTIKSVKESFTFDQRKALYDLLINVFKVGAPYSIDDHMDRDDVLDSIARAKLASLGWGGRDRKIYTEYHPLLEGAEFIVTNRKVVKTGVHCAGTLSYSYWGDNEWDPPMLDEQKTHVILELMDPACVMNYFWIERTNVEKVEYTKTI